MTLFRWQTVLVALALAMLIVGWGHARADDGTSDLGWWTVPGGGGQSASSSYTLSGSIGQAAAGSLAGGDYTLWSGFWASVPDASAPEDLNTLYLPLAIKR